MEFISAAEAARRWHVTPRAVQLMCAQGRVPGAERVGRAWRVPEGAVKPVDLRRSRNEAAPGDERPPIPRRRQGSCDTLMPLMNAPFAPGHAREYAESLPEGPRRDVALAELAYFTGDAARAAALARPLLASEDAGARLSACLICAYASLALDRINDARSALARARAGVGKPIGGLASLEMTAAASFVARTASVLLHIPEPEGLPPAGEALPLLPPGLRLFACYVQAHRLYLEGEHQTSLGLVLGAFAMQEDPYPIPAIYLHLVAVMDLMAQRRADEARAHLLAAWDLARPDGLIEPLAEHHGLLGGMLEAAIKPAWPDDFRRIIDVTYRFSAGWRRVHNPATGDDVADNLTTTEFATCMLAARGWSNAEIAAHMGISVNRVKECISKSLKKLGVSSRKELGRFLLS